MGGGAPPDRQADMLQVLHPVRSLLLAIFVLMAGSGFVATLTGLRLDRAGVGTMLIGMVATAYFAGLVAGALRAGAIVGRVGHIRAFAACLALLSASTLVYPLAPNAAVWMALRLIDGFCVAGAFICLESWLNDRAPPGGRGETLAAYMIALYSGQAIGQLLLGATGAYPGIPFQVAAILISLAIIPLCLTRSAAPSTEDVGTLSIRTLFAASPLGTVGATATGMILGAFYGLAAIHARRIGLDLGETARFMMFTILGGVVLQWPLGRLSDRYDRRLVMLLCLAAAMVISLILAAIDRASPLLPVFGALFGGLSFSLYPLCVAHCNDRLAASERVAGSGRLVLLYSLGAAIGPTAAAVAMSSTDRGGLFLFVALVAGLTAGFGLWRQIANPPVPEDVQGDFRILPRTTPMASLLQAPPRQARKIRETFRKTG